MMTRARSARHLVSRPAARQVHLVVIQSLAPGHHEVRSTSITTMALAHRQPQGRTGRGAAPAATGKGCDARSTSAAGLLPQKRILTPSQRGRRSRCSPCRRRDTAPQRSLSKERPWRRTPLTPIPHSTKPHLSLCLDNTRISCKRRLDDDARAKRAQPWKPARRLSAASGC
jgi:hypothetical protein